MSEKMSRLLIMLGARIFLMCTNSRDENGMKEKTTLGVNVKSLLKLHLIKLFRVSQMKLRDRIKKGDALHFQGKIQFSNGRYLFIRP